jgi:hypothetical protein
MKIVGALSGKQTIALAIATLLPDHKRALASGHSGNQTKTAASQITCDELVNLYNGPKVS